MTATIHMAPQIKDTTLANEVQIPVQSVFYDGAKQAYVWKLGEDMTINKGAVKVGAMDEGNTAILSCLVAGGHGTWSY